VEKIPRRRALELIGLGTLSVVTGCSTAESSVEQMSTAKPADFSSLVEAKGALLMATIKQVTFESSVIPKITVPPAPADPFNSALHMVYDPNGNVFNTFVWDHRPAAAGGPGGSGGQLWRNDIVWHYPEGSSSREKWLDNLAVGSTVTVEFKLEANYGSRQFIDYERMGGYTDCSVQLVDPPGATVASPGGYEAKGIGQAYIGTGPASLGLVSPSSLGLTPNGVNAIIGGGPISISLINSGTTLKRIIIKDILHWTVTYAAHNLVCTADVSYRYKIDSNAFGAWIFLDRVHWGA
jgi:hypothetical protein